MQRSASPTRLVGRAVVLALAVLVAACHPVVEVTDPGPGGPVNELLVGVSHTDVAGAEPIAPGPVELAVLGEVPIQNVFLMGWGSDNPEPAPGQYNWASLDARVALIEQTGAEPVLTLCCAPDWMKGHPAGATDWGLLTVAPRSDHFDDFAALAAVAAQRYPQITRFQVWNELKGFYDPASNAWDAVAYTELYNAVYHAVKAVRPDARVGGPYAPLELWSDASTMSHPSDLRGSWGVVDRRPLDVLEYWLANHEGADFVSLDGWIATRDRGLITDPFTATEMFAVVTEWLRARTDLPVWWSEVHVSDPSWSPELQDSVTTLALVHMARSGASVALLWSPQADASGCIGCLWSDPTQGPVVKTPLSRTVEAWARCAPVGGRWLEASTAATDLIAVAATDAGTFVANRTTAEVTVMVGTVPVVLPAQTLALVGTVDSCHRS